MTPTIRSLFTAVSLMAYATSALADEPYMAPLPPEEPLIEGISEGVLVDLEGFFNEHYSTPYIGLVHQQEYYPLHWSMIKQMILTDDYRFPTGPDEYVKLPQDQVRLACQMLKEVDREQFKNYNLGGRTLPPLDHTCG